MEFSNEALRGIIYALPEAEIAVLHEAGHRRGVFKCTRGSEARRIIVQRLLIDYGYILPFESPVTDLGATEYDEALLAQEIFEEVEGGGLEAQMDDRV